MSGAIAKPAGLADYASAHPLPLPEWNLCDIGGLARRTGTIYFKLIGMCIAIVNELIYFIGRSLGSPETDDPKGCCFGLIERLRLL